MCREWCRTDVIVAAKALLTVGKRRFRMKRLQQRAFCSNVVVAGNATGVEPRVCRRKLSRRKQSL